MIYWYFEDTNLKAAVGGGVCGIMAKVFRLWHHSKQVQTTPVT